MAAHGMQKGPAPVHLWDPPYCGDIDIRIARDGTWLHEGRPIRRAPMVALFASILMRGEDGEHYLVSPVEKVRIQVDDCPFVVNRMEISGEGREQSVQFATNTGEVFPLNKEHTLRIEQDPGSDQPHPVVHVRHQLYGLLSRPVFYRLVSHAEPNEDGSVLQLWSEGELFEFALQ